MTNLRRSSVLSDPATVAWLALVAATGIGWWLGHTAQSAQGSLRPAIAGVIVTAFVKVWIVGFQFMELKHAPRWLRHSFDAWVGLVCAILVIICLA